MLQEPVSITDLSQHLSRPQDSHRRITLLHKQLSAFTAISTPTATSPAIVVTKGSVSLPSCLQALKLAKGFQFIITSWYIYCSELSSFLRCFKINYHSSSCATHLIMVLLLISWFKYATNCFPLTWEECCIRIPTSN